MKGCGEHKSSYPRWQHVIESKVSTIFWNFSTLVVMYIVIQCQQYNICCLVAEFSCSKQIQRAPEPWIQFSVDQFWAPACSWPEESSAPLAFGGISELGKGCVPFWRASQCLIKHLKCCFWFLCVTRSQFDLKLISDLISDMIWTQNLSLNL